jgi:phosphatidylglycerol:prolipoprotein diacylglycerol transferase
MLAPVIFPVLPFPVIDPVALQAGPFAVRWYALAYIAALLIGWRYMIVMARRPGAAINNRQADDFLLWATLGVILGGRLGYILFYKAGYYLANPIEILFVWQGGMSFHGGLIGVALAIWLFARSHRVKVLGLADILAGIVPVGLLLGRIANFINGELWGRISDAPWAMIFPNGGPLPRHPSQLYQAALEGIALFAMLWWLRNYFPLARRQGFLTGAFLAGYGVARLVGELFREPDAHIGFLFAGTTMGQLLSAPLLFGGLWLVWRARATTP